MNFASHEFLVLFLPVVFLIYICIYSHSVTTRNIFLLIVSLAFYGCYDWKYLLLLGVSITVTYICGVLGRQKENGTQNKWITMVGVVINLAMLLFFKYTGFLLGNLSSFLGITLQMPTILLPVGLSFFVFQSCNYLLDVRNGKVNADRSFINIALFVSFFPSITSGPILRAKHMLPQLQQKTQISFSRVQRAVLVFLWGCFVKMVIADRLALFTNHVFDNLNHYSGFVLVVCAAAYSVQIYCDFSGYSYMAIAVADLFGFSIPENFRQPYLATNIADFWRRWHISLTSWFTEYLYIPLGGNRKGMLRRYMNIAIVFLISGLWHGAAWQYIIWGGLHAIYQICGHLTQKPRVVLCDKLGIDRSTVGYRLWQRFFIFCITSFAWIFFRAPGLSVALTYIERMFSQWNPWVLVDKSIYNMGLSTIEWNELFAAMAVWIVTAVCRERGSKADCLVQQNCCSKFLLFLVMLLTIIVFGMYGEGYSASNFIYAGF